MSKKKLIIVIIVVVMVVIAVGAVYFFRSKPEKELEAEKLPENNSEVIRPVYSLDTFIVNLADKGGRRFLRIKMDLE